ncbi:MAG TPA: M48 family metalloprotease [Verrucomicrobiae bacterium]|nr:M48 family metalloprotease [Verrucomicrobiae bacterium]
MATDFFDREARAQKQTRRLVWLFSLAVLVVLIANNLLIASVVYVFHNPQANDVWWNLARIIDRFFYLLGEALVFPRHCLKLILHPQVVGWISFGTLLSIAGGCYYKILQLSAGGPAVAKLLGGRRIESGTTDADEQRLRNVIEEMAIASGTPVPEIHVLDNERGINAFAAGHTRDDVAIGVTRGGVKLLTRDELQGVIAHEFSHILNGDTRLNMKLIGLAHGLFWPTILGRVLTYGSTEAPSADDSIFVEDDKVKVLPTAPLGFLFVVLGSISLPFERLVKSAICRQREWLADAAAVQFTRNPAGIEGALKKIGGLFKQGRLDTPHAEVASHLYFANSDYESWFSFLSTHPPLTKRISAIDPAFDGNFPKVKMLPPNQFERDLAFEQALNNMMAAAQSRPESSLALTGGMTSEYLKEISMMRFSLPPEVKLALRTPTGAAGIIYSLLLSDDETVRAKQTAILRDHLATDAFAQTAALVPLVEALGDRYKLFLSEFAVPALRENNLSEHDAFHLTMQQLIECDGAIELFEYTLMKMVARQLRAHFSGPQPVTIQYGHVQNVLPECALLLSALAEIGAENETEARTAFAKGVEFLDVTRPSIRFLTRDEWDLAKVDAALTRLACRHDPQKRNILMACGKTVAANGRATERGVELLRAIADSLDCPMPPFVEAIRMEELAEER